MKDDNKLKIASFNCKVIVTANDLLRCLDRTLRISCWYEPTKLKRGSAAFNNFTYVFRKGSFEYSTRVTIWPATREVSDEAFILPHAITICKECLGIFILEQQKRQMQLCKAFKDYCSQIEKSLS